MSFSEDREPHHKVPVNEEFLKTHDIVNLLQALVADVETLKNDLIETFNIGKKWQQRFDVLIDAFEEQAKYYETGLQTRLKSEESVFTYYSISKLIYDCIEFYRQQAKDRVIEFRVDLQQLESQHGEHQVLEICMDQMTLRQAFLNVIDNAVKYSFSGTPSHPRWIEVKGQLIARHGKQGYELQISNLGVGIEADELHQVFEPGYQSRLRIGEERTGQGVGLTFVNEAVQQHSGYVFIQSFPQKRTGWLTRLTIWLPLRNQEKCGEE